MSFSRFRRRELWTGPGVAPRSALSTGKGFQIGDDGAGVFTLHVISVRRRAQSFAVRPRTLFQHDSYLLVGHAGQVREGRRLIGPVLDGSNRLDPDGSALQPDFVLEVAGAVAGRMALGAAGDFFDKIFSTGNFSGRSLCIQE